MDGKEINILTMSKVQAISQDTGIEFGIKNSGMLIKGKLIKNRGIKLNNEEVIKEIVEEFDLLKLKKSNSKKWKRAFKKDYLRRTQLVSQSKLNGGNKTKAINTGAVSLTRFGEAIAAWEKDELIMLDRRALKLKTMNRL